MKFFILVTDREIRGAFFFCLGIFFDMEQLSKYIQTSLTKKCFLCFVYFEFEHFAFFRWGYFRPFQQYQWQSPWQRQCWLYLQRHSILEWRLASPFPLEFLHKEEGFYYHVYARKTFTKNIQYKNHLSIHSQTALVRVVTRLLKDC